MIQQLSKVINFTKSRISLKSTSLFLLMFLGSSLMTGLGFNPLIRTAQAVEGVNFRMFGRLDVGASMLNQSNLCVSLVAASITDRVIFDYSKGKEDSIKKQGAEKSIDSVCFQLFNGTVVSNSSFGINAQTIPAIEVFEAELGFLAENELDDGMNYGVNFSLDMEKLAPKEIYAFVGNLSWGRLEVGMVDSADKTLSVLDFYYLNSIKSTNNAPIVGLADSRALVGVAAKNIDLISYAHKPATISYYSPSFYGAIIGISYSFDTEQISDPFATGLINVATKHHFSFGSKFEANLGKYYFQTGINFKGVYSDTRDKDKKLLNPFRAGVGLGMNFGYKSFGLGAGFSANLNSVNSFRQTCSLVDGKIDPYSPCVNLYSFHVTGGYAFYNKIRLFAGVFSSFAPGTVVLDDEDKTSYDTFVKASFGLQYSLTNDFLIYADINYSIDIPALSHRKSKYKLFKSSAVGLAIGTYIKF